MPARTTQLFRLLDQPDFGKIERYEVLSIDFNVLRRSLRFLIASLRNGDETAGQDLSDRFRFLLSKWLTVPVPFDDEIGATLREFGDPQEIGERWGNQIRNAFDSACSAGERMTQSQSPMRTALCNIIEDMRLRDVCFKIYCHRIARPDFESLKLSDNCRSLEEDEFIHSPKEYRESDTFETLIKVGPLRSRGWGSMPDAVLTAPRSRSIIQIVWSGSADELGFGYDPISHEAATGAQMPPLGRSHKIKWQTPVVTQCGDNPADDPGLTDDADEFQAFAELRRSGYTSSCTLVQIDDYHGILYPTHSKILSYDPTPGADTPFFNRLPGESLNEGMFVVLPLLDDVDFGGLHAEEGSYSRVWKERLTEEFRTNPVSLANRLRAGGIDLIHLHNSLERWCRFATTVIHAPQKEEHFEIMIRVLGINFDEGSPPRRAGARWWQYAWNEIRKARGEAIQTGRHEHEIVEEQSLSILNKMLPEIAHNAGTKTSFILAPPKGQGLNGVFAFHQVKAIEEGYRAPASGLCVICNLNEILQWRE